MAILHTENCEEITLPDPFYFGFAEDDKSLLIGFKLDKKAKYKCNMGVPYSFARLLIRVEGEPDVTQITYGGHAYTVPFEGDEQNTLEGVYFEENMLYMAFGDKEQLKQAIYDEEDFYKDIDEARGFSTAIDRIGCTSGAQVINSGGIASEGYQRNADREIGALITIAQIFATHYSITDRPRSGWEARGGNPYDKIIKEYEELLRG